MGNFVGDVAGLLMIALIVVLFLKFVMELNRTEDAAARLTLKRIGLYAALGLGTAAAIIISGGILYNYHVNRTSLLDYEIIWNKPPVSGFLSIADNGGYSFDIFSETKIFPLFPQITALFSSLLFNMYRECGLYISLISGAVTTVSLGFVLEKKVTRELALEYIMLFLCVPGIVFFFLPSPLALWAALFSLTMACAAYGKKYISLICAVLCIFSHLFGLAALVLALYSVINIKRDKKYYLYGGILAEISLILMALMSLITGGVANIEIFTALFVPLAMLVPGVKMSEKINFIYSKLILVTLSGFYIVCLMYQIV